MPLNPVDREAHARRQRRRRRQLLGAVICVLVLVGVGTTLFGGYRVVAALFDDSDLRAEYEDRLRTLMMYDPLPFASLDQLDQTQLRQACIWGAIYTAQRTQGSLASYERDPDTEALILPALEVDAFLTQLVGPDYSLPHESFESDGMVYEYSEEYKGYLIPATGEQGLYTPKVVKLQRNGRTMRVTVGYVPLFNMGGEFTMSLPTEPTKYMDYIFEKPDKTFYLTALEASEMKPPESSSQAAVPEQDYQVDYDPNEALRENLDEELLDAVDNAASSAPADGETAGEGDAGSEAAGEDGGDANSEDNAESGEDGE